MIESIGRRSALALVASVLFAVDAPAADLTGAWASDRNVCTKIFVKNNNKISFARDSDIYGSGVIFDGQEIRGKMARCHVKARTADGPKIRLQAVCATDLSYTNNDFWL